MINSIEFGRKRSWPKRGVLMEELRKVQNAFVGIAVVPTKIRTRQFPNTRLEFIARFMYSIYKRGVSHMKIFYRGMIG